jgi:hypothetical protein
MLLEKILLSADDAGTIQLFDGSLHYGSISEVLIFNLIIQSIIENEDILFKGNDGGSTITALTLDMSDGGNATFNKDILLGDDSAIRLGASQDLALFHDATDSTIRNNTGDLILDVAGDIILDADGGDVKLKDGGTEFGRFTQYQNNFFFDSIISDADLIFRGNDGGSTITALTLDMSAAGAATLNNGLTLTDGNLIVANGHGIDFSAQTGTSAGGASTNVEVLSHYETGSWTPTFNATDMVPGTGVGETNITYSARYGRYTRIGDSVHITGNIVTSGRSGTERAQLTVDGLPFTCGTPASHSMSVSFAYNFTDNATAPLAATAQSSTSHILLYTNQTSNAQCNTSDIVASGSSYFNFAGTYLVG